MAIEWSDEIVVANLDDEPALSDELGEVIGRTGELPADDVPSVVLNFGEVSYINSSNIAQLLKIRKRMLENSKALRLCSVTDEVWSVFLVTGLDKVFTFAPDTMTAIAGLQMEAGGDG